MVFTFQQIRIHTLPISYENWQLVIEKPIQERPQFSKENGIIHIGRVAARFLGVPADEDGYYNSLFDLVHSGENPFYLLSEESLDKSIDNHMFQSIQKVLRLNREQQLSINRLVAFLDGEQLLLKSVHPAIHRKIRESMIATLELFQKQELNGMKDDVLRRVLVDIIKWMHNHVSHVLEDCNPEQKMPRFIWYGNGKKSHEYFLYYLFSLGCDLLFFHPDGNDLFENFDPDKEWMFVHQYPNKNGQEPFPNRKRTRVSTTAYKASKEIETVLHFDGSGLYKPWQLRDYTPSSNTLKTTYDELFLIVKEIAMVRPGFEVKKANVHIPVVFSKIQGVSKNRKEFWDRLHELAFHDHTFFIRQFPFTSGINNDFRFHYRDAIGNDGTLSATKMIKSNYWQYTHLPNGLQKGIANAIKKICAEPKLIPNQGESTLDVQHFLFAQSLQIPIDILKLLQRFDYSQEVPKIILYNNENNGAISRTDAALLLLLNIFGIDLILFNPSGQNDLENYIDHKMFDTHWLDDMVFDLEFKEPSLFKKVLFNGILKGLRGE